MPTKATTKLKGVTYYSGPLLYETGALASGSTIQLIHESQNPYDQNAVAAHHLESNSKVGHIAKELSAKYCKLIKENRIIHAKVESVEKVGQYFDISVTIVYKSQSEFSSDAIRTGFHRSIDLTENVSGIYVIKNLKNGSCYIGSSLKIRERLQSHLSSLSFNIHPNAPLSSDFKLMGADAFEAFIIKPILDVSQLLLAEAQCISKFSANGTNLYNRTADGQGRAPGVKKTSSIIGTAKSRARTPNMPLTEFRDFGKASISDLKRIRAALRKYEERITLYKEELITIDRQNSIINEKNANVKRQSENYYKSNLKPIEDKLTFIAGEIKKHQVGVIASIWSNHLEFTPSSYAGYSQKIKVKDTSQTRNLIAQYAELKAELAKLDSNKPQNNLEKIKPRPTPPKSKSNIIISDRKYLLDFEMLSISDLDKLINIRNV